MDGVCTYLPFVGRNIPPIIIFRGEHAYFSGYTILSNVDVLGGDVP
jgi:hypothetical protein